MRCLQYPWLHTLKATQLKHLAQRTGIRSGGIKSILIANLEDGLGQRELPSFHPISSPNDVDGRKTKRKKKEGDERKRLSILSIDMGIRNLAFAHLLVDPEKLGLSLSRSQTPDRDAARGVVRRDSTSSTSGILPDGTITLNAWRRLAIPDELVPPGDFGRLLSDTDTNMGTMDMDMDIDPEPNNNTLPPISSKKPRQTTEPNKSGKKESSTFSPPIYAQHAYALMTTLLRRYRPTHILIERQRFRSGGGSAVQEWTLRVGVFEGMLYAVLAALGHSSSFSTSSCSLPAPVVLGIEPQRVARYWLSGARDGDGGGGGRGGGKVSAREGKKAKIDLAGGWLDDGRVDVGSDPALRGWVDGYLSKWKGGSRGKRKKSSSPPPSSFEGKEGEGGEKGVVVLEMGKLDDLADCLVQGVTWLEWQVMRERVGWYGPHVVEG